MGLSIPSWYAEGVPEFYYIKTMGLSRPSWYAKGFPKSILVICVFIYKSRIETILMCIAKERIIKVKKFLRIWMKTDRNIHTFMELWVIFDPVSTGKVKGF